MVDGWTALNSSDEDEKLDHCAYAVTGCREGADIDILGEHAEISAIQRFHSHESWPV